MLKRTFFGGLFLLVFCTAVLALHLGTIRSKDLQEYQDLLATSSSATERNSLCKPLTQVRKEIRKDLFLPEGSDRLHLRIQGESSEIALRSQHGKWEMVETLKNLECWMQEKGTEARHFTAEEGVYLFPSQRFDAKNICLDHSSGNIHSQHAFLQGVNPGEIVLEEGVKMTYESLTAKGGKAVFKRNLSDDKQPFLGILELYPEHSQEHCRVFHEQGEIFSKTIKFDLSKNLLLFDEPKGRLFFLSKENEEILFSAGKISWFKEENRWLLEKDVFLKKKDLGRLEANEMEIFQRENGELSRTIAKGTSKVLFQEKEGKSPQLLCNGQVILDHEKKEIFAESGSEQVFFYDGSLILSSDKAHLSYAEERGGFRVQEISFEDKVHFISREELKSESFGIADKIIYFPETQKLILTSLEKVLLWQEENSFMLSAKEIHIERDPKTSQYAARGIGDVRCSFDTEEEHELRKLVGSYVKIK